MKSSGRLVKEDPERAAVWQGRKVSSDRGRSEGSRGGFFKVIGHQFGLVGGRFMYQESPRLNYR